ncbi:MAG: SusD/RagB family nutrient-binding outer membrane lipoprotein [Cyclobacteriaceae bacterium]|nr:SusD/RagB family nutrient-binding outer membrane lipoprotein [Cyclobacteriaceae bacterium]
MKKIRLLYKSIFILPLLVIMGSCNEFLDVNQSPNLPEQVPPSVLLPSALIASAFANGNELNRFGSTVMDYTYGAGNNPGAYDIYNIDGAAFNNQWRFEIYGGALNTFQKLIEAAEPVGGTSYTGIAKIMKAYVFSLTTDVWGDIPYSQALQGATYPQPRIDKQEDIYKGNAGLEIQSLFDLVREGLADLNTTSTINPGVEDVVYGGTIASWRRAGYTLLLKLAMQISNVEPALAVTIINEVISANNYIVENSQNLSVKFGSSVGSQSPIYTWTYISTFQNDMMVSSNYVSLLEGLNDPRLDLFVTKPTGSFVTYPNGFAGTLAPAANRSKWSTVITGASGVGPVRLITNAQRAFWLAEAVLSLGVTVPGKTAQDLYEEGITASMTEAGVPEGDIDTYIADHALTGTTEEQIEQIITQKYIAQTGNGLEAWHDYRRTGYPDFPEHLNAVGIDGTRPKRAQYIDQEVQRNPNFSPVVLPNVRVWWDVD